MDIHGCFHRYPQLPVRSGCLVWSSQSGPVCDAVRSIVQRWEEHSKIDTLDLPDDDQNFLNSYQRRDYQKRTIFCERRDALINNINNISFIKMNSLQLINSNRKYDLIWIDGAHGYPYSTIDIINSLKLINPGGIILCDDVYKKTRKNDKFYISTSTYETLRALEKAKIIKYDLFYKRLDKKINSNPYKEKFIGIISYIK